MTTSSTVIVCVATLVFIIVVTGSIALLTYAVRRLGRGDAFDDVGVDLLDDVRGSAVASPSTSRERR